ncbi:MAG TPA: hypothetical protein VH643_35660 [Gemmataceae bacterium]|jgi:hypothetical protein
MSVSARARQLFLAELASRDIVPEELDDGGYRIVLGEMTLTVNLENKGREFDETSDETVLKHFVDAIVQHKTFLPQSWESVRRQLFFAAEPSDHEFGDTCRQEVSDQVSLVLVYLAEPGQHIVWMTPSLLAQFGVSREVAEAHAADNLARLMSETPIETTEVDGHLLGMLSTHSPLKASLIFAKNLRQKAEPLLGWPLLAVIPCRDFAYLIPESAQALFPRVAQVVVGEYAKRGYLISTEVFKIDSEKVQAIGEFQSPLNPPKGMKVINHDSLLTFFLPRAWEDDVGADGETMYYDPDEEENYLRVATQLYAFKEDLPAGTARRALASIAETEGSQVEDWPGERALVRFDGEEGEMRTWTWAVAGPATPRHLGLAVFTYHMPMDEADSDETRGRLRMLGEMLPRALFRTEAIPQEEG